MTFSRECEGDLALLGITGAQIVQQAKGAIFHNALESRNLRHSLFANTPAANATRKLYKNQTIQEWFSGNAGIHAAAELLGWNIYFRASAVDAKSAHYNIGLLLHEFVHNIKGTDDDTIKAQLGIPHYLTSYWVSRRLEYNCAQ
jgi:hypothetical protein